MLIQGFKYTTYSYVILDLRIPFSRSVFSSCDLIVPYSKSVAQYLVNETPTTLATLDGEIDAFSTRSHLLVLRKAALEFSLGTAIRIPAPNHAPFGG